MKHALPDILRAWDDLWQFPQVLAALDWSDGVDSEGLALGIVSDLAQRKDPPAVLEGLVGKGELELAMRLLELPGFRKLVTADQRTALSDSLATAEEEARADLAARSRELEDRARDVELEVDDQELIDLAMSEDLRQAAILIDERESRVEQEETAARDRLQRQLAEVVHVSTVDERRRDRWREAMQRCLVAVRLGAARALLERGPAADLPEWAVVVERPRAWPWSASALEVLDWIAGSTAAPTEFRASWSPRAGDMPAQKLMESMRPLLGKRIEPQHVVNFTQALEHFLGHEPANTPEIQQTERGYCTRLEAAVDARLPCLFEHEGGAPMWVATVGTPPPVDTAEDSGCVIWFTPVERSGSSHVLPFDAALLFALAQCPDSRRVNFLRALGTSVGLRGAIPESSIDSVASAATDWGPEPYVDWLLDVLSLAGPAGRVTRRLLYDNGGRVDLVLRFLRHVFQGSLHSRSMFGAQPLDAARDSDAWTQAVHRFVVPPSEARMERALLAITLEYKELSVDDFALLATEVDSSWNAHEIGRTLAHMAGVGLLERHADRYRLPANGLTVLLRRAIPDANVFLQ